MAFSGLFGPHPLSYQDIDNAAQGIGPGAYALGKNHPDGKFVIRYIGRSDSDLNGRLKQHVGNYTHFKYAFYDNSVRAYEKECRLYHDFGETALDNAIHPARPENSWVKCPVCGR